MTYLPGILDQGIIIFRLIVVEERATDDPSDRLEEKVLFQGLFKSLRDVLGHVLVQAASHNGHQFLPLGNRGGKVHVHETEEPVLECPVKSVLDIKADRCGLDQSLAVADLTHDHGYGIVEYARPGLFTGTAILTFHKGTELVQIVYFDHVPDLSCTISHRVHDGLARPILVSGSIYRDYHVPCELRLNGHIILLELSSKLLIEVSNTHPIWHKL